MDTEFDHYCGELIPIVKICTELMPAFSSGNFRAVGKMFCAMHEEIHGYIQKDIGRAAQRRLACVKSTLFAPIFVDMMRLHDLECFLPSKEELLHAHNLYDHGTISPILLEIFGQNFYVVSPLFPWHMLMRFLDAGEAEFMMVFYFQLFVDMIKMDRGSDM
jgi:hypothetical protein